MKTTPILLKLLQKSAGKASPNFNKTASRKGDGGFTLLEVLATVLVLGILSSIAAPSWLAFINRQRVRTVNDRVLQTLRTAQSEAKRSKRDIVVTFISSDPPTATINTTTIPAPTPPIQTVTFDAGGEIKRGQVTLTTNTANAILANSITFDYQGNRLNPTPFVVTVAPANSTANSAANKQCAIVETLIGGMRTAEGQECH